MANKQTQLTTNNDYVGVDCLGVVLAGGLSSRMGQNKANLPHFNQQQAMLDFSKQILTDAGASHVVVSGNGYDINDDFEQLGPLSGIYSVMQACLPKALLILPVDLPLITSKMLKTLKLTGEISHQACFFQQHFLPLYLPNNAYSELFFAKTFGQLTEKSGKGPAIKQFIAAIPHCEINTHNQQALLNCNTPADWQQAQQLYAQGQ